VDIYFLTNANAVLDLSDCRCEAVDMFVCVALSKLAKDGTDNQSSEHVTLSKSAAINFPFRNSSFPGIIMSMYRKPKATLLLFPHQIVIKKLNCKSLPCLGFEPRLTRAV
jgi:hypothetical protein